jgi:hypothetical protein
LRTGTANPVGQFRAQHRFTAQLEVFGVAAVAFLFAGAARGQFQVVPRANLAVQVADAFHPYLNPLSFRACEESLRAL